MISINHYDLPSLFAAKLHALLFRKYTKGRDYYDLIWYLSRKVKPNYLLLNSAVRQTQHKNLGIDQNKLVRLLTERINATDFKNVIGDVGVFLEDYRESRFLQKKIVL